MKVTITGKMLTEKQGTLEIYKHLDQYKLPSDQGYLGENKEVFEKEEAKEKLFEYFYSDKTGNKLAEEEGEQHPVKGGFVHGNTRVLCALATGKGQLQILGLSEEKAKELISELVEEVYSNL